jgi:hypothetical protein
MAPYRGLQVVSDHRSFANFADRFGLDIIGYVEPRPGIPPTRRHTASLIDELKRQGVKLVLVDPYFDLKMPAAIAREAGTALVVMPPSVGGVPQATDYRPAGDGARRGADGTPPAPRTAGGSTPPIARRHIGRSPGSTPTRWRRSFDGCPVVSERPRRRVREQSAARMMRACDVSCGGDFFAAWPTPTSCERMSCG